MTTRNKYLGKLLEDELGPMTFGSFLRGARASNDMTQVEMARLLKISRSALCDIEMGRHLVSPQLASRIARVCGLSEKIAVRTALQDQVNKAKLKMKVAIAA